MGKSSEVKIKKPNSIKIMHQNIQSLNSNNLNLVSYIESRNFDIDIIVLTEAWKTNVNTYKYLMENYQFVNKESEYRAGGIVIYIKENIHWKEIKYERKTENYDILIISFKNNIKNNIILIAVYRHISTDPNKFRKEISEDIDIIKKNHKNKSIIIVGDMNIDITKDEYRNQKYLYEIELKGLKQIVKEPTRITEKSKSLIDHVFMDMERKLNYKIENFKIDYGDHNIQILTLEGNLDQNKKQNKSHKQRIYNKDMEEPYVEYISKEMGIILEKFKNEDMEVDEKFDRFTKIINNGNDIYFPLKEIKEKKHKIKWFNKDLRKLRKEKDRKYKIWHDTRLYMDKMIFVKVQKHFKEELKIAEKNYYKNCIQMTNNKEQWKTINQLLGRKGKINEIEICDNEGKKISQLEVANQFNNYFIEAGNVLSQMDKESENELHVHSKRIALRKLSW